MSGDTSPGRKQPKKLRWLPDAIAPASTTRVIQVQNQKNHRVFILLSLLRPTARATAAAGRQCRRSWGCGEGDGNACAARTMQMMYVVLYLHTTRSCASTAPSVSRGFHHACEDLKPKRKLVVHAGDESFPLARGVEAVALSRVAGLLG